MSPYRENESTDHGEIMARLRAWLRERGITQSDLRTRTGLSTSELARLFDQGSDGTDANAGLLDRVITAFGGCRDYVLSGAMSADMPRRQSERLRIWALIERFSDAMELKGGDARHFAAFAMHRYEPLMDRLQLGLHSAPLPRRVEDISEVYQIWHTIHRRR